MNPTPNEPVSLPRRRSPEEVEAYRHGFEAGVQYVLEDLERKMESTKTYAGLIVAAVGTFADEGTSS